MSKDKALRMALEALEMYREYTPDNNGVAEQALTALREALAEPNEFNPDWDAMAVMVVEEQQRMAKRIEELEAQPEQEPRVFIDHRIHGWPDCFVMQPDPPHTSPLYTSPPQRTEQEPVAWESLLGAIARGWCHEKNANKEMDADLVYAIATEIKALYTTPPQRKPLTDEELDYWIGSNSTKKALCRAVEAAHGIRE